MTTTPVRIWFWVFAATVLAVGTSEGTLHLVPDEYPTIQAGIDAAGPLDTVLVASGIYHEYDIVMKSEVCLRSETGEPRSVTIDAQQQGRVFICDALDAGTRIEGFTITGGLSSWGAGLASGESSVTISACVFVENTAVDDPPAMGAGGGIACWGSMSELTLVDCRFLSNWAPGLGGAIRCCCGSLVTLVGCELRDNSTGGSGGAIDCNDNAVEAYDTVFFGNSAFDGAALWSESSSIGMWECTIAHGSAVFAGSGLVLSNSDGTLERCTMSDNYSDVIRCWYSSLTMDNCIIAFTTSGQAVSCGGDNDLHISCCDIYGNADGDWAGCISGFHGLAGNIHEDPLFCSAVGGIYTLHSDSPCAGENNPGCGQIGRHPIGCGPSTDVSLDAGQSAAPLLDRTFPNPFSESTRITYSVPGRSVGVTVVLSICDPAGRLIRTLVDAAQPAGTYSVVWDGKNQAGEDVAGGVYFCRLSVYGEKQTRQAILVR